MLSQLQGVADEIVVAVDSRIDPDRLGHYATVADRLHRFEFAAPIERAWPWLYSQASCDWILRLDGDEVASPGLIEELPELIEEKDVIQYWLPRRWLFPDRTSWIFEWPWWPDYTNRLTRNDPLLWIPGLSHTAAEPELPARYLEAPLYHLDTVLNTLADRQAKIARYRAIDDALREPASDRYLATFFLPEKYVRRQPLVVPDVDRVALDAVLDARPNGSHPAALDLPVVARDEIDRCWPERELDSAAYRATIRPLDRYRSFAPGEHRQFHVLVRNEGDEIWPGGDRHPLILAAYRWLRQDGSVLVAEGFRSALSCPLAPSDELVVAMTVAAPDQAGTFLLEIDLVHELKRWFGCPLAIEMRIEPATQAPSGPIESTDPAATIRVLDRYRWLAAGWHAPFYVVARNESGDVWPGNDPERPIRLGSRWFRAGEAEPVTDGYRTAFPVAVRRGDEVIVPMIVEAPGLPGRYLLEIDVVHEFVRWFGQPARVEVDIRDAHAAPLLNIEEEAPEWLATTDPQFFDRVTRLCGLEHEEALTLLFEPGPPVAVAIPALAGHAVRLRPRTSDLGVLDNTFWGRYHLPPPELHTPELIIDLGSNIGLTIVDFCFLFPRARVIGVELDRDSAALARSNVEPWSDRTTVVEAAIWSEDGTVTYRRRPGDAWAHHVDSAPPGEETSAAAMRLDTLLDSLAPNEMVDYLKVDIEGAESELFKAGGRWSDRVRVLKVEVHEPYSVAECIADLSRLGFSASADASHFATTVVARGTQAAGERAGRKLG